VHPRDGHSNKSQLVPPTAVQLARLAERSRSSPAVAPPDVSQNLIPRSLRRRVTPEMRETLVVRYQAGEPFCALSLEFNISETGLRELGF
jgi:hypothetical protein